MTLCSREMARVSALKAEDRLLVVAHRKQRAVDSATRAASGKKFARNCLNDRPLAVIGVLRLINQDMVGRLIKLVANPIAHPRRFEQFNRLPDQIIIINQPAHSLCLNIMIRKFAPDA